MKGGAASSPVAYRLALRSMVFIDCFLNFDHLQNIFQIKQSDNLSTIGYTNHPGGIALHPFK
jgi:hypothetical protein